MNVSPEGIAFTQSWEGCSLTPYQDEGGVWTNGIGNTTDVDPNVTITQEQADADFVRNGEPLDAALNKINFTFAQNQYDALRDFGFNEGVEALLHSTLLAHIESGGDIAGLFELWDKVREDGVLTVSAGLLRRRKAEDNLYTNGDYGT
jgi:lysozyme